MHHWSDVLIRGWEDFPNQSQRFAKPLTVTNPEGSGDTSYDVLKHALPHSVLNDGYLDVHEIKKNIDKMDIAQRPRVAATRYLTSTHATQGLNYSEIT